MIQIGVLLTHQYKLLSLAAMLEVFETVNKLYQQSGETIPYNIQILYASEFPPTDAAPFFGHAIQPMQTAELQNLILIPSFTTEDMSQTIAANRVFIPWLAEQYQAGAEIASFCTGAFLLGATGLLNGRVATTHVDACPAFAALFPAVQLRPDKTVTQDGRLYTSGGATSLFHLLLHLIQLHCGKSMAIRTAKIFAIDMDRDKQSYFSTFQPSRNHSDLLVATAQQKIESSYHDKGTIEEMIKDIPSSRRNIVRRFKQVTGITPIEYLQQTRMEAAKKMLEQTDLQMTEVIINSGYNDLKAFRKVFRKTVGMTPSEYRDKFNITK
ncbi:GlxA family transcriptional regulator [Chitinophaga nivalis]|uniref:Helix-turn-helix domain-containing protein n=1 Tax=Chitinophaga nivalis TaxID=2991709 RepID=A0ABT3IP65_9BACT|nr:helix-turn-helix domain-containing protein [Chitinophaga nivalis]MCW3464546.1 helix-turn-helix domain-containing protein [Chitinophaga nivalis]MCW3485763.1 helix-turn-helix domain-containing protein [Chitinophaga nivalis]